jgi:hypothetical protein
MVHLPAVEAVFLFPYLTKKAVGAIHLEKLRGLILGAET